MAADVGILETLWRFFGGDNAQPSQPGSIQLPVETDEVAAIGDLQRELQSVDSRIRGIKCDIARENDLIREELMPYANCPKRIPSVVKISINSRRQMRAHMEQQLKGMYAMRVQFTAQIYNIENSASHKQYTATIRNANRNAALVTTDKDIRDVEDTIEMQRENEYRQREVSTMISVSTRANLDDDDEGIEEELGELFADMSTQPIELPPASSSSSSSSSAHVPAQGVSAAPQVPSAPPRVTPIHSRSREMEEFADIM